MVCPNCGAQNEAGAKFCADCGNKLPEAAPVAAPMPPATPMPAAQPLPAAPPPWAQPAQPAPAPQMPPAAPQPAPQTPPPWSQAAAPSQSVPAPTPPPWAGPQPQQPPAYPQQQAAAYQPQGYPPQQPVYGAQGYNAAPAAAGTLAPAVKVAPLAALLAIAGGAIAIASGWLPWETGFGMSIVPMDKVFTDRTSDLANGYFLVAGGAIAAVCGLLLFLGIARTKTATTLLGIGAIVGGAIVVAVEATFYSDFSPMATQIVSMGYGVYVGIVGGAVAIAGGALALAKSR